LYEGCEDTEDFHLTSAVQITTFSSLPTKDILEVKFCISQCRGNQALLEAYELEIVLKRSKLVKAVDVIQRTPNPFWQLLTYQNAWRTQ
jgi:hypothetical protein